MSGILPTKPVKATRINPKIILFYGIPKVGKTKILSDLTDCLTLDTEGGAEMYDMLRLPIKSISGPTKLAEDGTVQSTSINEFIKDMNAEAARQTAAKEQLRFPYKYIAVDTIDKLEDYCEIAATAIYKSTTIGKNFDGKSVLDLPNGAGYYHLRNEVLRVIDQLTMYCKHLILISHVKEKTLDKGGVAISYNDISLTGKLGSIVCAKCDGIGYLFRQPGKPLMVSFETFESSVMGARFSHLAGQKFEFSWDKIFIPEPTV
jgi:hypothetical protein